MVNVVLVCVAGVSGTFLARRIRELAPDVSVTVTGLDAVAPVLEYADLVLVGPQVADQLADIERFAGITTVALLPATAYAATGAEAAVGLIRDLTGEARRASPTTSTKE